MDSIPPECPAPQKPPSSELYRMVLSLERKIITPEATALLLFASFVFGIVSAGFVIAQEQTTMEYFELSDGSIAGYVLDIDGQPVPGAEVRVNELSLEVKTNEYGYYLLSKVPPGEYDLIASSVDYRTLVYRITIDGTQPKMYSFSLEKGYSTDRQDRTEPSAPPSFSSMRIFVGGLFILGSISSLIGAVFAYRRKGFKRTLSLAVLGLLSYGFFVGSILAGIGAGFIMAEKHAYIGCPDPEEKKNASVPLSKDMICSKCRVHIFAIEPYVECRCGKTYHLDCVKNQSCTKCGQSFVGL